MLFFYLFFSLQLFVNVTMLYLFFPLKQLARNEQILFFTKSIKNSMVFRIAHIKPEFAFFRKKPI